MPELPPELLIPCLELALPAITSADPLTTARARQRLLYVCTNVSRAWRDAAGPLLRGALDSLRSRLTRPETLIVTPSTFVGLIRARNGGASFNVPFKDALTVVFKPPKTQPPRLSFWRMTVTKCTRA